MSENSSDLYKRIDPDFERERSRELQKSGARMIKQTYYSVRGADSMRIFVEDWARKLFNLPDIEKSLKKLGVKFQGPKSDAAVKRSLINLMNAKITACKTIKLALPITEKRLDEQAAYSAIREAYLEVLPELSECITLSLNIK